MNSRTTEEAGLWDARLRAPDCTEADRARFAAWREAYPAHRAAFENLQTIVASLRHESGRADVRALRDEALRASDTQGRRRLWVAALAAGVALLGVGVWKSPAGVSLLARLSGTQIFSTGIGQRSTFVLADGSSVELNSQSRLHVAFNESRRGVELMQGQALFDVARDARRPFIVRAGDRQIVAVGTRFDVRLDAQSVQVTLIEGKVRIERGGSAAVKEIELTPGKQLIAKAGNVVRDIDVAKVTGWREGRVFLEDQPLADAVAEMNRYSAVRITVADEALGRLRVNGMFRAGEQEAFVAALGEYFPISAEHRGAREIVLSSRP